MCVWRLPRHTRLAAAYDNPRASGSGLSTPCHVVRGWQVRRGAEWELARRSVDFLEHLVQLRTRSWQGVLGIATADRPVGGKLSFCAGGFDDDRCINPNVAYLRGEYSWRNRRRAACKSGPGCVYRIAAHPAVADRHLGAFGVTSPAARKKMARQSACGRCFSHVRLSHLQRSADFEASCCAWPICRRVRC